MIDEKTKDITGKMYNTLEKYFNNFYLLKKNLLENRNIYVFDEYGYYLVVYCDKQDNVIDELVSEYY